MAPAAESVMSWFDAAADFRWPGTRHSTAAAAAAAAAAVRGRLPDLLFLLQTLCVAQNIQVEENVPAQPQQHQIKAKYLQQRLMLLLLSIININNNNSWYDCTLRLGSYEQNMAELCWPTLPMFVSGMIKSATLITTPTVTRKMA